MLMKVIFVKKLLEWIDAALMLTLVYFSAFFLRENAVDSCDWSTDSDTYRSM